MSHPDSAYPDAPNVGDAVTADRDATPIDRGDGSDCLLEQSSTIPHVRVQWTGSACTFTLAEAAAGISIPYDLVVDEDVPNFVPGRPYAYGIDPSNLDIAEDVTGGGQHYCLCDEGLPFFTCPGGDGGFTSYSGVCSAVTIPAGVYHHAFTWDGRNWTGPSDTGNPKGPPFPAGDYELAVSTGAGSIHDGGVAQARTRVRVRLVP